MTWGLEADFQIWKAAFREELGAHLAALTCDKDLFGFALEPAEECRRQVLESGYELKR